MKPIIFNQRVTVFTNSFIGYSDAYKQELSSKLTNIEEVGILQPNFALMVGPQQIISPNQMPQNAPWFIKVHGIKVEFMPNKIDVVSDLFVETKEDEISRLNELTELLARINAIISIGSITRMAYAPSFGLEGEDGMSVNDYWSSIIRIPDMANSRKQERMIRYNTICRQNFGEYSNVIVNRVITISEGQRTETKTTPEGKVDSKTIECVIISIDINTSGITGNYLINAVDAFCKKAQIMGQELLAIMNN